MRKKLLSILFLLSSLFYLYSNEYLLFTGKTNKYNELLKDFTNVDYAIKYDDQKDIFYFKIPDWLDTAWIHLSWKDMQQLRKNFEKYFEWESVAIKNEEEIKKDLPDSTITTNITWNSGDNWYYDKNFVLNFVFFSQSKTCHQLVLHTSKATGSNRFATYKIDGFYFDKSQVQKLYDGIEENKLKEQVQNFKKEKEKENLFK